jgi:hypothetical protein
MNGMPTVSRNRLRGNRGFVEELNTEPIRSSGVTIETEDLPALLSLTGVTDTMKKNKQYSPTIPGLPQNNVYVMRKSGG